MHMETLHLKYDFKKRERNRKSLIGGAIMPEVRARSPPSSCGGNWFNTFWCLDILAYLSPILSLCYEMVKWGMARTIVRNQETDHYTQTSLSSVSWPACFHGCKYMFFLFIHGKKGIGKEEDMHCKQCFFMCLPSLIWSYYYECSN